MVTCAAGIKLLQLSLLVYSFCKIWNLVWGFYCCDRACGGVRNLRSNRVKNKKKNLYINPCVCINYHLALTYKIFTNVQSLCIKSLCNSEFQVQIAVIKKENTFKPKYDIDIIYFNYIDKHEKPMSFKKAAQAWN